MVEERIHIHYSGYVQGVGFRYTAERLALSLGLKGWVKNLRDGRVEVVCEGKGRAIDEFTAKIAQAFKDHIRDVDMVREEAQGTFSGFNIKF
jgi:acylphosphatase